MNPMTIEQILARWFGSFSEPVGHLFAVGGAVRDRVLGLPGGDLDLVCDDAGALAESLAAKRDAALVVFRKKDHPPCFRLIERGYTAFSMDIAPLRGGDILMDLASRDFTVNAMAMEVTAGGLLGGLLDPFGGRRDLDRRVVRMTAPGVFLSDPLRIFRAFRFAAELDFTISPATLAEAARNVSSIAAVAGERILAELELFLGRERIRSLADTMAAAGMVDALFPGIAVRRASVPGVSGPGLRVFACAERMLEKPGGIFGPCTSIAESILDQKQRRLLVKTAALVLDTGGILTEETADAASRRLCMSGRQREGLRLIASGYRLMRREGMQESRGRDELEWFRALGDEVPGSCILAAAEAEVNGLSGQSRDRIRNAALRYIMELRPVFSLPPLVRGKDLSALGIPPGPVMGEILKSVRDAQDRGEIAGKKEALRLAMEFYSVKSLPERR